MKQKLPLDGRDAWPTIAAGKKSPHDEILFNSTPYNGAIRVGDWKLVLGGDHAETDGDSLDIKIAKKRARDNERSPIELFNLKEDPSEKNNLASTNPEKVKELKARYDVLAKQAVTPKNLGTSEPK